MGTSGAFTIPELTSAQFAHVSRMLYEYCGIVLQPGKAGLVTSRLIKRLHRLGMSTFEQYLRHVATREGSDELTGMLDALTTNKTSFFREPNHFDFLRRRFLPESVAAGRVLRIWSAGCSSGEEPYSVAITLQQELPVHMQAEARILATDVSERVLTVAREAVYPSESLHGLPLGLVQDYFTPLPATQPTRYRVHAGAQKMVRFARLNLKNHWPMRGPFDAILCRNVMIYFDRSTQRELIQRFTRLLRRGGYLLVGHSESISASNCGLQYVQPAVYAKIDE